MSAPLRAMIVDDEPIARRGVRRLLSRDADVEIVDRRSHDESRRWRTRFTTWGSVLTAAIAWATSCGFFTSAYRRSFVRSPAGTYALMRF